LAIRIFLSTDANVGGVSPTSGISKQDRWHVSVVAETGSTNDDLLRAAEQGELADRTVLRTEHQTAGRGRLDRRWDAPAGSNLLASMYLASPGGQPGSRVQRVGVAIVDAIIQLAGTNLETSRLSTLGLKWPNDVLLDGRKLAGVLAQRSTSVPGVVVGFGVNVGWAPRDAARVHEVVQCSPGQLLDGVLDAFDAQPGDPAAFAEVYRSRLLTLGQFVRVHLPGDETFDGRAVDIDADGRIVVVSERAGQRVFDVGDVVHLRSGAADVDDVSD
jgi:BirA family biotin operon repressor/biotin-[acetyl-CoA-carboxylase] ligase